MEYGEVWVNPAFDAVVMVVDDPVGRMPARLVTAKMRTSEVVQVLTIRDAGKSMSLRNGAVSVIGRYAFGSGTPGSWIREGKP
jgi:hypothetical protein